MPLWGHAVQPAVRAGPGGADMRFGGAAAVCPHGPRRGPELRQRCYGGRLFPGGPPPPFPPLPRKEPYSDLHLHRAPLLSLPVLTLVVRAGVRTAWKARGWPCAEAYVPACRMATPCLTA